MLIEGLVYKKDDDKPCFYVPDCTVINILRVYHDNNAHCGIKKVIQGIRNDYWFPSKRKQAQSYVNNCLICLIANSSANTKEGELQLKETPKLPMHTVHIDHFGPLIDSISRRKHILVLVDSFTRFIWLLLLKTTSSRETIENIIPIFNVFGNPNTLVSDRGTSFTSSDFI